MKTVCNPEKNICILSTFLGFQNYIYSKVYIIADLPSISEHIAVPVYGEQSSQVYAKSTIRRCLQ